MHWFAPVLNPFGRIHEIQPWCFTVGSTRAVPLAIQVPRLGHTLKHQIANGLEKGEHREHKPLVSWPQWEAKPSQAPSLLLYLSEDCWQYFLTGTQTSNTLHLLLSKSHLVFDQITREGCDDESCVSAGFLGEPKLAFSSPVPRCL